MFGSTYIPEAGRKALHRVANLENGAEGKNPKPDQHARHAQKKTGADADADLVSKLIPSLGLTQGCLRLFYIDVNKLVQCGESAFQRRADIQRQRFAHL